MRFTRLPDSRPPPFFELHMRISMESLANRGLSPALPAKHLRIARQKIESLLLAECLIPSPCSVALHLHNFFELLSLTVTGKPVLYRQRHTLSLLFSASGIQSEMHIEYPDELIVGYTQTMMGFLLFNPAPERIGMIGLGGGSLAKFCYRYLPRSSITVAEISPEVIKLRDQFRVPKDDERIQISCIDGATFIEQAECQFDILMIDGFDKDGQPPQLCSPRFYEDCYRALTPNGIMVVNVLGGESDTPELMARIRRTFDGASIAVDALDSLNKIVFAFKGTGLNLPEEVLKNRIDIMDSLHPIVLRLIVKDILRQRRTPELKPSYVDAPSMAEAT